MRACIHPVWVLGVAFAMGAFACGGSDSAGASSTGAGGAGGSTVAGTGGATGSGGSGGQPVSCTGMWGAPELVLADATGAAISSLAITQDELVLFYTSMTTATGSPQSQVLVSKRAKKTDMFMPGVSVPELSALCTAPSIPVFDVTQDGLDVYIGCDRTDFNCAVMPCDVHHASRVNAADGFVEHGIVATGVGASPAIAPDQLTIYTSALDPGAAVAAPLMAERADVSKSFGPPTTIPGATSWTKSAIAPELSADGLEFYAGVGSPQQLAGARRATTSDPFPEPAPIATMLTETGSGSPDLSGDCRALYFISVTQTMPTTYQVYVMRR